MAQVTSKLAFFLLILTISIGIAQAQGRAIRYSDNPSFQGRPLSAWIQSLRNRDDDMERAFQAIKSLGPRAASAVPELIRIISDPVNPIRVGTDSNDVIAQKLVDFQTRADAVDCLKAIGQAASSAAAPLIEWALAKRVIPENISSELDYHAFVDLVGIDVIERMRAVNVISGVRLEAATQLMLLINSGDNDRRKLAVAVLRGHALPIATMLLQSDTCADRKLGANILLDLWAVVPTDHLEFLKLSTECVSTLSRDKNP